MTYIQALIIAIVEGITEFLPVSSTAHMVLTGAIIGVKTDEFSKLFEIVIQLGAILAIVVLYFKKFFDFKNFDFYIKLFIAVIPALAFGALFKKHIDAMLEKPVIIAAILLVGGILLLFVDRLFTTSRVEKESNISIKNSFIIGCYQVLAIIFPGLSRSAATIIGGMQQGLNRKVAAEFSFFLAVPTMFAASAKSFLDVYKDSPEVINSDNMAMLGFGSIVAFVVAILAVKFFIEILTKYGFKAFGYYRILVGGIILALYFMDIPLAIS